MCLQFADEIVSVWDWLAKKRLNYFCNGNPRGTSITSLDIINQDVGGLILTGSGASLFFMLNPSHSHVR